MADSHEAPRHPQWTRNDDKDAESSAFAVPDDSLHHAGESRRILLQARRQSDTAVRDNPGFMPAIETRDVFSQLIANELRRGRMTRAHHRRIVRYAAQMGLSKRETRRLIEACLKQALSGDDTAARYHALRLVKPKPDRLPVPLQIALIVLAAILLDWLILGRLL